MKTALIILTADSRGQVTSLQEGDMIVHYDKTETIGIFRKDAEGDLVKVFFGEDSFYMDRMPLEGVSFHEAISIMANLARLLFEPIKFRVSVPFPRILSGYRLVRAYSN